MDREDPNRRDVRWSPRVAKAKVRRLYESVAAGFWDAELIDDVGMTLYMRCRDILKIHRVQKERLVTCPRCERAGTETLIARGGREDEMTCPACGWSMTWHAYHRTFQRRQLNPGGAVEFFRGFVERWERARDPRTRMLAIDRLIHEFHYSCRQQPDRPTRSVAVNFISGKLTDVVAFLDDLSGLDLPEDIRRTEQAWRQKHEATWPGRLGEQAKTADARR